MNNKAYVIGRLGWEYNDEVMYRSEGGGSIPMQVYKDKATAEQICKEMNIEWLMKEELESFCYDLDDLFEYDSRYLGRSILERHGITELEELYGLTVSAELAEELLPYLAVIGYEVTEVEFVK